MRPEGRDHCSATTLSRRFCRKFVAVAMTYRAWKTPRHPRPCPGPSMGRNTSKTLRGYPISAVIKRRVSITEGVRQATESAYR